MVPCTRGPWPTALDANGRGARRVSVSVNGSGAGTGADVAGQRRDLRVRHLLYEEAPMA